MNAQEHVIVRYRNRKTYSKSLSKYVGLSDIAQFARDGHRLRVVDYASGFDITSATLAQVLWSEIAEGRVQPDDAAVISQLKKRA